MITKDQVRMARAYYDMSRDEFAEMVGCSRTTIGYIESGLPCSKKIETSIREACHTLTFTVTGGIEPNKAQ